MFDNTTEIGLHETCVFKEFSELVSFVFRVESVSVLNVDSSCVEWLFNEIISDGVVQVLVASLVVILFDSSSGGDWREYAEQVGSDWLRGWFCVWSWDGNCRGIWASRGVFEGECWGGCQNRLDVGVG